MLKQWIFPRVRRTPWNIGMLPLRLWITSPRSAMVHASPSSDITCQTCQITVCGEKARTSWPRKRQSFPERPSQHSNTDAIQTAPTGITLRFSSDISLGQEGRVRAFGSRINTRTRLASACGKSCRGGSGRMGRILALRTTHQHFRSSSENLSHCPALPGRDALSLRGRANDRLSRHAERYEHPSRGAARVGWRITRKPAIDVRICHSGTSRRAWGLERRAL